MKFKNKNVFITGASRGIGRAMALAFAKEGANIAIHCHHFDKDAASLSRAVEKLGRKFVVVEGDLSTFAGVSQVVSAVMKSFNKIDILINNAGRYPETEFFDSTEESYDSIMDTNLKSIYFCSQLVGKKMLKAGGGQIINIASVAGIYPRNTNIEYALSKAGVVHLSKCLAMLFSPKIRVNCIAPSYTKTSFMAFMKNSKLVAEKKKLIPTGEFNEPGDIAAAALYLASREARNVTGQVLVIDGGRGAAV